MYLNPWNVQTPVWTLMQSTDSRWQWHVNVGSSVVMNVPLWAGMTVGEAMYVWGKGDYGLFLYFLLNFAMGLKLLFKIIYLIKEEKELFLFSNCILTAAIQSYFRTPPTYSLNRWVSMWLFLNCNMHLTNRSWKQFILKFNQLE